MYFTAVSLKEFGIYLAFGIAIYSNRCIEQYKYKILNQNIVSNTKSRCKEPSFIVTHVSPE